jgi:hypothetical protein
LLIQVYGRKEAMPLEKRVSKSRDTVTVTFRIPLELGATAADLVGEFTDWKLVAMQPQPDGSLVARFDLAAGHAYRFRYLIDGQRWENDWKADRYAPNEYGGDDSVVDIRRHVDPDVEISRETDGVVSPSAHLSPEPTVATPRHPSVRRPRDNAI